MLSLPKHSSKTFVYGTNFMFPVLQDLSFKSLKKKISVLLKLTRLVSAFLMNHPSPGGNEYRMGGGQSTQGNSEGGRETPFTNSTL